MLWQCYLLTDKLLSLVAVALVRQPISHAPNGYGMSDLGVEPLDSESQSLFSLNTSEDGDPRVPELTDSQATVATDDRLPPPRWPIVVLEHPRLHGLSTTFISKRRKIRLETVVSLDQWRSIIVFL